MSSSSFDVFNELLDYLNRALEELNDTEPSSSSQQLVKKFVEKQKSLVELASSTKNNDVLGKFDFDSISLIHKKDKNEGDMERIRETLFKMMENSAKQSELARQTVLKERIRLEEKHLVSEIQSKVARKVVEYNVYHAKNDMGVPFHVWQEATSFYGDKLPSLYQPGDDLEVMIEEPNTAKTEENVDQNIEENKEEELKKEEETAPSPPLRRGMCYLLPVEPYSEQLQQQIKSLIADREEQHRFVSWVRFTNDDEEKKKEEEKEEEPRTNAEDSCARLRPVHSPTPKKEEDPEKEISDSFTWAFNESEAIFDRINTGLNDALAVWRSVGCKIEEEEHLAEITKKDFKKFMVKQMEQQIGDLTKQVALWKKNIPVEEEEEEGSEYSDLSDAPEAEDF